MSKEKCKKCGYEISQEMEYCPKCGKKKNNDFFKIKNKNFFKNKKILFIIGIIALIAIISISVIVIQRKKEAAEQERYNNLPVKVDISMTSYFGEIYYILYELGLDFDLVTMGANCFTGTQKGEFKTEKYGILHTEYRYCKSNYTLVFRVYNDSKDQELRDPKPGELAQFDKYGKKVISNKENNF